MDKYNYEYDDPYKMLASNIAVSYNIENVRRIMTDKDYIRQLIQAEVRDVIDLPGIFSDCVTTELISEKQKVLYRNALNMLGIFFYDQIDIPRLRNELKTFYAECGIDLMGDKK